ncbi:MAG: type II secretion system F family protein, partial [Acidimicrobiales bacterium]
SRARHRTGPGCVRVDASARELDPMTGGWVVDAIPMVWAGLVLVAATAFSPSPRRDLPTAAPAASRSRMALLLLLPRALGSRRARRRREAEIARELPEIIELLSLALAGGGSVQNAVAAVASVGEADGNLRPVSRGFGSIPAAVAGGHRFSEALEQAGRTIGPQVKPVVRALLGSDHYGTAVRPTLQRLAHEAREARRRRAQTAVRKLPVQMLWPLVLGVLPAFVLLTIVPILAGTLEGLGLPPPAP